MVFSCDAEACYVGYMKNHCPGLHVSKWQLLEYYSFVTPILDSKEIKWGKEKTKPAASKACPASSKECNKFVAYILEARFYTICPLNKNLPIWHPSSVLINMSLGSQPHDGGQL